METNIFWKAVYFSNCKYQSVWAEGNHRVTYDLGKYTTPSVGKLFVFDTLEHTEKFVHSMHYSGIFKCEITGTPIVPKCIIRSSILLQNDTSDIVKEFWDNKLYLYTPEEVCVMKLSYPFVHVMPVLGTILVDSVKLIDGQHSSITTV